MCFFDDDQVSPHLSFGKEQSHRLDIWARTCICASNVDLEVNPYSDFSQKAHSLWKAVYVFFLKSLTL